MTQKDKQKLLCPQKRALLGSYWDNLMPEKVYFTGIGVFETRSSYLNLKLAAICDVSWSEFERKKEESGEGHGDITPLADSPGHFCPSSFCQTMMRRGRSLTINA